MNADDIQTRRAADRGTLSTASIVAQKVSRSFWAWFDTHHIDSLAVIGVTLWLTVRVVEWSIDFPYDTDTKLSGVDKAAIIAAVMTPWGLMQAFLVKWYMDLKVKVTTTDSLIK